MAFGPAIVAAVLGVLLGVVLVTRYAVEVRARHELRLSAPDFSSYDPDVRRYLERVWLLVGAWKPRLSADGAIGADALWSRVVEAAMALQSARAQDAETAELVGELVRLEGEVEAHLTAHVSP